MDYVIAACGNATVGVLNGMDGRIKYMTNLEKAKQVIKEHYHEANCGIFDCRNTVGDPMTQIYGDGDLFIDICYYYMYFEVFGLSDDEFKELAKFYNSLEDE